MKPQLILDTRTNNTPLTQQSRPWIGSDFPFTLNPTIGCPYGCIYCFSPVFMKMDPSDFNQKVKIRSKIGNGLYSALNSLKYLPQYYKRVQINETSDIYHPEVFNGMKSEFKIDLMRDIYKTFEDNWLTGNKWMLHILTKSNLILDHLPILDQMKEMVQVEISICSTDEKVIRKYEKETPPLKTRLKTIETLTKSGIFVRVMAMPFLGDKNEAEQLKNLTINAGARAFKHKALNYFELSDFEGKDFQDYLAGRITPSQTRNDTSYEDLSLKSGEKILTNGKAQQVTLNFHSKGQDLYSTKSVNDLKVYRLVDLADCGYNQLNTIDWEFIK